MRYYRLAIGLVLSSTVASCVATSRSGTSEPQARYEEDLSVYRAGLPEIDKPVVAPRRSEVSDEALLSGSGDIYTNLAAEMDTIHSARRERNRVTGYTLQLYNGVSRERANELKKRAYEVIPHLKPWIEFDAPNWRLKLGEYYTLQEAQHDFFTVREHLPTVVLVNHKIKLD